MITSISISINKTINKPQGFAVLNKIVFVLFSYSQVFTFRSLKWAFISEQYVTSCMNSNLYGEIFILFYFILI